VPGESGLTLRIQNNGKALVFFQNMAYNAQAYWSYYPTGTPDSEKQPVSRLTAYPNPATDYLTLTPVVDQTECICFSLVDLSGKTIARYNEGFVQPGGQTFTIYTGNIPAGEYILQMSAGSTAERQKVVIIK